MYCKGHPECRRFGYARGGSLQGSNFESMSRSRQAAWQYLRDMAAYGCCCLLAAHGMFALHASTTAAAGYSLAQTMSEPALIAGLARCQCFTFTARTDACANGRASHGELSAVLRRHPCISMALVTFAPSQWVALKPGPVDPARFMWRNGPSLVLAMGFGRIG